MKRFLIGQYGGFDDAKFRRDFRQGFYGIEACLFQTEADIQRLVEAAREHDFRVCIHYPLRAGRSELRDALFLSQDCGVREEAFALAQQELDALAVVKPSYVLFHYPKPVILDDRVNWSRWRFADSREYVYESRYKADEFAERSEALFRWLSEKGEEYEFTPVLEFDGLNGYVYGTGLVEELLQRYDKVKLCLDTGRLYLQERIDPFFDARHVIRTYAKYAEVVHLWNLRYTDRIEQYHDPVLPEQDPADGWAPIADYLAIIAAENHDVNVHFEHRSDLISDEELERCYAWVERMLAPAL
jgi:hypothetical protein